jgi:glucose/arabinose dehydrogenase
MINNNLTALLLGATLITAIPACKNGTDQTASNPTEGAPAQDSTYAPVETEKPNTDYKPAFTGQTRAPGAKTKTALNIQVLTSDLDHPWAIAIMPDGRFLITEKTGSMRILTAAGQPDKKITGLPEVISEGQGGLLDVILDPDFASNRMVFWNYSENTPQGTRLAVAKGKLSADETKFENISTIYRVSPAFPSMLHYGSRIVFDKQGNLIVSTGERSDIKSRPRAQDLKSSLGKTVHITKEGKPVPNGPFANNPNALPEIYSLGHRNPNGLAWNPATGDLWESEFGPRGGDEINIIREGRNYGWPTITYGLEYSGEKVGPAIQQKEGLEQPVYYWDPVVSPAGITFYNSDVIPEWKNNLFIGGLSSMHIARLIIKDDKVVAEERLLSDEKQRFRAIAVGKDGALYAVTDAGRLYKVSKK